MQLLYVHSFVQALMQPLMLYFLINYQKMGIEGLWINKIIVETSIVTGYVFLLNRMDWEGIAQKASDKLKAADE